MVVDEQGFAAVATVSGFPESGRLCLELDERYLVLVRVSGQFFCLEDVCTHDGGPLGEGALEDDCLVCPRHGARFDVRTGEAVKMPATEPTPVHQVQVNGDQIMVQLHAG